MARNSSSALEQPDGEEAVPNPFTQNDSDAGQGLAPGPLQSSSSAAQGGPSQEGHAESYLAGEASNDHGNVWQLPENSAGQILPGQHELPNLGNDIQPASLTSAGEQAGSQLHANPCITLHYHVVLILID